MRTLILVVSILVCSSTEDKSGPPEKPHPFVIAEALAKAKANAKPAKVKKAKPAKVKPDAAAPLPAHYTTVLLRPGTYPYKRVAIYYVPKYVYCF